MEDAGRFEQIRGGLRRFTRGINSYCDELFSRETTLDGQEQEEYSLRLSELDDSLYRDLFPVLGQSELPDNLWHSLDHLVLNYTEFAKTAANAMNMMVCRGSQPPAMAQNVQHFLGPETRLQIEQLHHAIQQDVNSLFEQAVAYVLSHE
jgi:hypothetical protein